MTRGACALVALAALAACGHELELPDAPPPPPPEITALEADPGLARAGTELAITVAVRGDPGGDPAVDVDGTPAEKLTGPDASGAFAYRYVARGTEEQGRDVAVRATLRTGATSSVPVRFDFEPPALVRARGPDGPPARVGTLLAFELLAKEELRSAGLRFADREAACEAPASREQWRCALEIQDGDPEGAQTVSALLVDLAGNEGEEVLPDPVVLDFTCAVDASRTRLRRAAGLPATFDAEPGAFEPGSIVDLLPDPQAATLVQALAGAEGEVATLDLASDVPALWVRATDPAGNATPEPLPVPRTYVAGFAWQDAAGAAPNPTTVHCMGTAYPACGAAPSPRMLPSLAEALAAPDATADRDVFRQLAQPDDERMVLTAAKLGPGASFFRDLAAGWAPSGRFGHRLVPVGDRVLLVGGFDGEDPTGPIALWQWSGGAWSDLTPPARPTTGRPGSRHGAATAYDPQGGGLVVFGGWGIRPPGGRARPLDDTWVLDGTSWRRVDAAGVGPSARTGAAMAHHGSSMPMVLFGGTWTDVEASSPDTVTYDDTWLWDGTGWGRADLAGCGPQPPGRAFHSMEYDPDLGEVVLFGGIRGTMLDDAWSWDGACWHELPGPIRPPARAYHAMAYSAPARGFHVFGGWGRDLSPRDDTWLLHVETPGSASWRELSPPGTPGRRWGSAMATDDPATGRAVLFGGLDPGGQGLLADTWSFDGVAWTRAVPPGDDRLAARDGHALAVEPGGAPVLVGGRTEEGTSAELVRLVGDAWERVQLAPGAASPPARWGASLAAGPGGGELLLFGGLNDVEQRSDLWAWNGTAWEPRGSESAEMAGMPPEDEDRVWPIGRVAHAAVQEGARDRLLVFGGLLSPLVGGALADTWLFADSEWSLPDVDRRPPARSGHALAYDEGRDRVVLFGGADFSGRVLDDTWEWDGARWAWIEPLGESPAPRTRHSLSYDPILGAVLLFGGEAGGDVLGDAWEWDGASWLRRVSSTLPPPRAGHAMVHDPARGAAVLVGGSTGAETLGDTWEYRPRGAFPVLLVSFDVAASGLEDASSATLTAVASGVGATEGGPRKLHGVRLSVSEGGMRWRMVGENRAARVDDAAARTLQATWAREELAPLLADGQLHVLLVPLRGAALGVGSSLAIDHLELRLDE